jgi:hypothetical protein
LLSARRRRPLVRALSRCDRAAWRLVTPPSTRRWFALRLWMFVRTGSCWLKSCEQMVEMAETRNLTGEKTVLAQVEPASGSLAKWVDPC